MLIHPNDPGNHCAKLVPILPGVSISMKWAITKGPEGTVQKQVLLLIATVEPVHNGHLGNRRNWSLWIGVCYEEVGLLYDIF